MVHLIDFSGRFSCYLSHPCFFDISILSEGKIPPDEPAILPPLPIVPKVERRKSLYRTLQSKRPDYRDRDWDHEWDRDFELMPPPGRLRKEYMTALEVDQPIDPNEPIYCICQQVLGCCS